MSVAPTHPEPSATNPEGDFDQFKNFMRQLIAVPHEEIKARIKAEKGKKRTSKPAASPDPAAS